MKPGTAAYVIEETRGDDWLWSVQFSTLEGTPSDLTNANLTAELSISGSRRVIDITVDADPTTGHAVIAVDRTVTSLYSGKRNRVIITATIDGEVHTPAVVRLFVFDPDSSALLARTIADQISITAESVSLTIITDLFAASADVTPPTITTPSTATCPENSNLSINLTASESVTWTITGGADQADFEISGHTLRWLGNGTKNFEVPDDTGTNNIYDVQVTATDLSSNATNKTISVTVTNVNEAPFVANAIPDQSAIDGTPASFQFASNTFGDADAGDTLTYSATQGDDSPLPGWITFTAGTRTFNWSPTTPNIGTQALKVIATDSGSLTATAAFNLTVGAAGGPVIGDIQFQPVL